MTSKNSFDRHCSANNVAFILLSDVYNLEAQLNCSGQQKTFLCNALGEEGRERWGNWWGEKILVKKENQQAFEGDFHAACSVWCKTSPFTIHGTPVKYPFLFTVLGSWIHLFSGGLICWRADPYLLKAWAENKGSLAWHIRDSVNANSFPSHSTFVTLSLQKNSW